MITTLGRAVESGRYPGLGQVVFDCPACGVSDINIGCVVVGGYHGVASSRCIPAQRVDLSTVLVSPDLTPGGVRELMDAADICRQHEALNCREVGCYPDDVTKIEFRILIWDGREIDSWPDLLYEECPECEGTGTVEEWHSEADCECGNGLRALPITAVILCAEESEECFGCHGTGYIYDSGETGAEPDTCGGPCGGSGTVAGIVPPRRVHEWITACEGAGVQAVIARWKQWDVAFGGWTYDNYMVAGRNHSRLELS